MVTVASRNCQQSPDLAITFLENTAAGCDAICVQEAGTRENRWNEYKNQENVYIDGNCFVNDPCLVVTKLKERAKKVEVVATECGLNWNRSALLTTLRGGALTVVNVHLTSGNAKRAAGELLLLVEKLEEMQTKWLIIGDFNCNPSHYTDFAKKFMICEGPPHGSGRTLDYAMSNHKIEVKAFPNYFGSDHGGFYIKC